MTNEALEQEIIPIMNEFKVRFICSRRGHPTRQHIGHMNVDDRVKLSWSGEAFAVVGRWAGGIEVRSGRVDTHCMDRCPRRRI